MDLKVRLTGLNRLLTEVYGVDTRLSLLLGELGLTPREISELRGCHLVDLTGSFLATLERLVSSSRDAERGWRILVRRFSLDGQPPDTLRQVGEGLGVSRERVRQLQGRIVARLRSKRIRAQWEMALLETSASLVGATSPRGIALSLMCSR